MDTATMMMEIPRLIRGHDLQQELGPHWSDPLYPVFWAVHEEWLGHSRSHTYYIHFHVISLL